MSKVVEIQKANIGEMDEYFIEYYLSNSEKFGAIADAYRYAKKMLGQEFEDKYAKQNGQALFRRLRDKISETLDEMEVEDASLSRNVLRTLASDDTVSASTRVAAAKELARKRIDRPSQKKPQDLAEIDERIEQLEASLKEQT